MINKQSEQSYNDEAPEVTALWDLFNEGMFEETIINAEQYLTTSDNPDAYSAKKLIGLSLFRKGDYAKSQSVFELLADTQNNLEDWFNLLTSSALNDSIVLSEKALEKVIEFFKQGSDGGNISLPYVYFYYINALSDVGQYDLAFKKFKLLAEYYVLVKITDTHFLHMRGIPFFQNTLSLGKKIFEHVNRSESEALLDKLMDNVDTDGQEAVTELRSGLS